MVERDVSQDTVELLKNVMQAARWQWTAWSRLVNM